MKSLALLVLLTAACHVAAPARHISMPERQVRGRVEVDVHGILGTTSRPLGVAGTVENLTNAPLASCSLTFEGYGNEGEILAKARGTVENLPPGFPVEFKADFPKPTPTGLRAITLVDVRVKR